MKHQPESFETTDAILMAEEPAAWTLDELESSADIGSLRSAWAGSDEAYV